MSQEEFGKLIKRIRKENNLTQKDLAEKYNVTYQAVSKWENGKNMPDISLIKQISKDFNITIEDMIDGNYNPNKIDEEKEKNNKKLLSLMMIIGVVILVALIILILNLNKGFEFKIITSGCNNFDISGSMSYDNNKSVIYINNITYCGAKDDTRYENITCSLFEKHDSNKKELSICDKKYETTLEEFLKDTTFHVDNTSCKNYSSDHLYLEIYATKTNGEKILYEVPMRIQDSCE